MINKSPRDYQQDMLQRKQRHLNWRTLMSFKKTILQENIARSLFLSFFLFLVRSYLRISSLRKTEYRPGYSQVQKQSLPKDAEYEAFPAALTSMWCRHVVVICVLIDTADSKVFTQTLPHYSCESGTRVWGWHQQPSSLSNKYCVMCSPVCLATITNFLYHQHHR